MSKSISQPGLAVGTKDGFDEPIAELYIDE